MLWYVHWNAATVALDCDFFTFLKESYDHFYNSAYDSAPWKNNEKTTVQAQKTEQAVKILQHSRLQAAAGKWARAPPDKEEKKVTSGEIEPTKGWHFLS